MASNELTLIIKGNSSQLVSALSKAGLAVDNFSNKSSSSSDKTKNAFSGISGAVTVAAGNLISAGIHKSFDMINSSVDGAIRRVDILNNFPKVMSNLGISADASKKAIMQMSESLKGLPTSLDNAAASVQRLTSKNGDVGKSTEMFLALNNAILAGGAPMDIQATAIEQISQAYAKGKPDMMEWRALQSAMPAQLKQIAQAFFQNGSALDVYLKKAREYAAKNPMSSTGKELLEQLTAVKNGTGDMTTALGTAMRTGIISMDDFMATITKMNKEGVNGFQSFEKQARNSTGGIQTAMENSKTAVVRGVAKIIEAFGSGDMSGAAGGFGKILENVLTGVADMIKFVKENKEVFTGIAIAVGVLTGAVIAYDTAVKMSTTVAKAYTVAINLWKGAVTVATTAQKLFTLAMNASPLMKIVTVIGLVVGALAWFFTQTEEGRKIFGQVAKTVGEVVGAISRVAGKISEVVGGALATAGQVIGKIAGSIGNIVGVIGGVIGKVAKVIGGAVTGIIRFFAPIVAFVAPIFQTIWQIISSTFILIVAIVATVMETIFNIIREIVDVFVTVFGAIIGAIGPIIQGIVDFISGVIGTIGGIIQNIVNFVSEVVSAVAGVVQGVVDVIVGIVTTIIDTITGIVLPVVTWMDINIIQPIAAFFKGLWDGVVNGVRGFINGAMNIMIPIANWINSNVIQPVARFFSGLWSGITNGVRNAARTISDVMGTVAGFVKAPINGIIDIVNGVIRGLNRIKVPDWVPGLGGKSPNFPMIPKLATGGIVSPANGGSIIYAGDGGQNEWVVPESKMASLVAQINKRTNGDVGGLTKHIVVNNTYNVRDKVDAQMVASDLGYLLSQA
nr:MAG TPA: minor tail protein [Caudoviricetes sp.]